MRGVLSVSGVIGTWAGPRSAGHRVRDGPPQDRRRRRRQARRVGLPRGRHGRGHPRARATRRESFGATVRTERRRRRGSSCATARARGVVTDDGRGDRGRRRDRGDAPADHVPQPARRRPSSPTTSSTTSAGGRRRSGTVKVNLALDRLPGVHRRARLRPRRPRRHDRARTEPRPRRAGVPGRGRGPARRPRRSPTSASRRCSTGRSRPRAST